jgi:hypothetical protein
MIIKIDKEYWKAFHRIVKRFFTNQECGMNTINNKKCHYRSKFGIKWYYDNEK